MQIVGRACEVCSQKIVSELDGVGCERCRRFFHDACLTSPRGEETDRRTYRAGTEKRRQRAVTCPGCGVELRQELTERNRTAAAVREAHDEGRRVAQATGSDPAASSWRMSRVMISIAALVVIVLVRFCAHR